MKITKLHEAEILYGVFYFFEFDFYKYGQ